MPREKPKEWPTCVAHKLKHSILSHLSLNGEGRWGTTDDFATSFLNFSLFSTSLWDLANSRPFHSLMLSSHLFLCLPGLLPPLTVPYKIILARPDERETWSYYCSLRLFTMVRFSCGPVAMVINKVGDLSNLVWFSSSPDALQSHVSSYGYN